MTKPNQYFYKIASVAAVLSAITTILLWLLPRFALGAANFEDSIMLAADPYYMAKQWVNFIHIFLALLAYYALSIWLNQNAFSKFGFCLFLIWGFTELLGVSMIIFALNYTWRINYSQADEVVKGLLHGHIDMFGAMWDGMFFLLLIAFLLANIIFGALLFSGDRMANGLSILFFLGAILTIGIIISNYTATTWPGLVTSVVYPVLQPASRIVLGVFLWRRCAAGQMKAASTFE